MKYSLLIPTRERPNSVIRLLTSINEKTKKKEMLEILFAVDQDDFSSIKNLNHLQEFYKDILDIKVFIKRNRSIFLNRDYYNWLAEKATGDMLWILGDDVVFYIDEWETFVEEKLENYFNVFRDRIVCASIRDNTPKPSPHLPKFPCFPMFSKEAFKVMGFLLHPKVPTWGADYVAYVTFEPLKRLFEIWDKVFLNHVSYHTRQVKEDKTNIRIGHIFNQMKNIPVHNIDRIEREELPNIRHKLQDYINVYNSKHRKPGE